MREKVKVWAREKEMNTWEDLRNDIEAEYTNATHKFPKFNSYHEGYAVLKEEMDELWNEIKGEQRNTILKDEAIQVAAMAIRFIIDCCKYLE